MPVAGPLRQVWCSREKGPSTSLRRSSVALASATRPAKPTGSSTPRAVRIIVLRSRERMRERRGAIAL